MFMKFVGKLTCHRPVVLVFSDLSDFGGIDICGNDDHHCLNFLFINTI